MPNIETSTNYNFGQILHRWQIPEYHQYERGRTWYIVMGLITMALITYALFTANFLFALLILLFAAIVFMSHIRPPLMLDFLITDKGVVINNKFYPHADLKSFWLIYEPPAVKNLYLEFQSRVRPPLSVHLDTQEPAIIRETLSKFIVEDGAKKEEPFSDLIWRMLKL